MTEEGKRRKNMGLIILVDEYETNPRLSLYTEALAKV